MNAYLAQVVTNALPPDNGVRTGTVEGVDGGTVRVLVNGGVVDCGYLSSYNPQVRDTVALMREKAGWLVMGAIGGGVAVPAESGASVQYRYLVGDNPKTNDATFATDPNFVFDAEPNTAYGLDALITYFSGPGLLKHQWLFPSGRWLAPSYLWDAGTADAVAVVPTTYPAVGGLTSGYAATTGLPTLQAPIWVKATLITGDTGGKIRYQWAQTAANATATTLLAGTRMRLERYGPA
jgi:hypothetical protein